MSATAFAIGGGLSALSGIFGGQQEYDPKDAGDLHLVNAGQLELWNSMHNRYKSGAGDYGFGSSVKQGKSQLQQMMADRGISPQSGVGMSALAEMIGTASAADSKNRSDFGLNLLRSPLQTAQTAGSNWLSSSPSQGAGPTEQWQHFAENQYQFRNQYGLPYGNPRQFSGGPPQPPSFQSRLPGILGRT